MAWGYNLNESIKLVYNCNERNKIRAIKETKEQEESEGGETKNAETNNTKATKNQHHQKYPIVLQCMIKWHIEWKGIE